MRRAWVFGHLAEDEREELDRLRVLWLMLYNAEESKRVLDARRHAGDDTPALPDPIQAVQEFLIAHYEWRHALLPDDYYGGTPDA